MRSILFLLIFGLTGLGVLLWLGIWQVQRLVWKQAIIQAIDARVDGDPVLVIARSASDPEVTPLPVDSSAITNNHLNYAITWFLLALTWVAMTACFLWRTRADAES